MAEKEYIYSDLTPVYNTPSEDIWNSPDALESQITRGDLLTGYDRSYDIDAIKQSLINLFLIESLEVPGKPYLGNPLSIKVFELFDSFSQSMVETSLRTLIQNYEPRVQIEDIRVTSMEELNRLIIEIDYFAIIDNRVIGDTVYLPFAHNTRSFIDGRGVSYKPQI